MQAGFPDKFKKQSSKTKSIKNHKKHIKQREIVIGILSNTEIFYYLI